MNGNGMKVKAGRPLEGGGLQNCANEEPPIHRAISRLGSGIQRLNEVSEWLRDRLAGVCEEARPMDSPGRPAQTPGAVDERCAVELRVDALVVEVEDLIARLEDVVRRARC